MKTFAHFTHLFLLKEVLGGEDSMEKQLNLYPSQSKMRLTATNMTWMPRGCTLREIKYALVKDMSGDVMTQLFVNMRHLILLKVTWVGHSLMDTQNL